MVAFMMLSKQECYGGINDLYDTIATKLGFQPDKVQYDCTKIRVTKAVQDQVFCFYKEQRHVDDNVAMSVAWAKYGPKASLAGDGCDVEIDDGFIVEVTP